MISSQDLTPNSALRTEARNIMSGNYKQLILFTILYTLLTSGASTILYRTSGNQYSSSILLLFIGGPLSFGLSLYYLSFIRNQSNHLGQIFEGFSHYKKTFLLYLVLNMMIVFFTILFIIPGIIVALRYSMVFYILVDEPDLSISEILQKSSIMTKGNKGKIFMLGLSFLGWTILSIFTLGIGLLFLIPYIQTSTVLYYEELKTYIDSYKNESSLNSNED